MAAERYIDLSVVASIVAAAEEELDDLHCTEWSDLDGQNSTAKAVMSKRLNHLADLLLLGSALVRNEYWAGKGFTDLTSVTD